MPFSQPQKVAIALVPKFPAFLSVLGSLAIFSNVVSRMWKRDTSLTTRHRIMAGLSMWDCLASVGFFLTTWAVPSEVPWVVWNYGNQTTCNIQGFLTQSAIGTVMYMAWLSFYFLVAIVFHWRTEFIERFVEPWIHVSVNAFTIVTGAISWHLRLYNPTIWDCWIMPYPLGCQGDDCVRGGNAEVFQYAFNYIIIWACTALVTLAMVSIFCGLRRVEMRSRRLRSSRPLHRQAAWQGAKYVGAMLVTWSFISSIQVYRDITNEIPPWWAYFVGAVLLPGQGFLNYFIYFYGSFRSNERRAVRRWTDNWSTDGFSAMFTNQGRSVRRWAERWNTEGVSSMFSRPRAAQEEQENNTSTLVRIWNTIPPPQDDLGNAWESAILEENKSESSGHRSVVPANELIMENDTEADDDDEQVSSASMTKT